MKYGIDVSENNGNVDFVAVKNKGYDFVIIRLGYGNRHLDSMFYENVNKALEAGLDIGIYYYDYGLDVDDAINQARFMIDVLEDCGLTPDKLKMGVWYDMEDADGWKARHGMPSNETITDMCFNFVLYCNKHDYNCGVYASYSWLTEVINMNRFADYVPFWNAQWGNCDDIERAVMWQYSSEEFIDGKFFDANVCY